MPNIAAVLKTEIARISRKEVRNETEGLQATVAQQRKELAALKRQIVALEKSMARVLRMSRRESLSSEPSHSIAPNTASVKFSAAKLAKHRERLGISANEYGALVGASGQSVYKWESGKAFPRAIQLERLSSVLSVGKRAFQAQQAAVND